MGSSARSPDADRVAVSREGDLFVALDEETGVASQGETKPEALANLAEALELHQRPVPEDDEPTEPSDAPWL